MDSIYIDTNVLIDVFLDRKPYAEDSENFLFEAMIHHKPYISSLSFHIVMYISKPSEQIKVVINKTLSKLNIVPVTKELVLDAFKTDFKDYEDILQFNSAVKHCRTIVTRDPKDFKKLAAMSRKKVEVLSPKQWLKRNSKKS